MDGTIDCGAVLVVDEIEASMHPLLTRHLIEMIQDQTINQNHAQLIFTTHDTGLLDLKLLAGIKSGLQKKTKRVCRRIFMLLRNFHRERKKILPEDICR